jgi:hypothetical protein
MAAKRRRKVEEMVSYLHGLNSAGDVVSIAVYKKGGAVRLSGPHGSHLVHQSNDGSLQGWIREAQLVWNLSDVYDTHPTLLNSDFAKSELERLKRKGAEQKQSLAEHTRKSATEQSVDVAKDK